MNKNLVPGEPQMTGGFNSSRDYLGITEFSIDLF